MTQSTLWCNSCLDCLWVSYNNLMLRFVENFYPFHFQDLICKSLFLSAIQFLWWWFSEFGIGSTNGPLVDIFLYSQHLSAWQWTDVVRRCSILVMGVKGLVFFGVDCYFLIWHWKIWRSLCWVRGNPSFQISLLTETWMMVMSTQIVDTRLSLVASVRAYFLTSVYHFSLPILQRGGLFEQNWWKWCKKNKLLRN